MAMAVFLQVKAQFNPEAGKQHPGRDTETFPKCRLRRKRERPHGADCATERYF